MRAFSLISIFVAVALGVWWVLRDAGLSPNQANDEEFVPITQPIEDAEHVKALIEGRSNF
jgi:hypothetical protein